MVEAETQDVEKQLFYIAPNLTIGGRLGDKPQFQADLGRPCHITNVVVACHDRVGRHTNAKLEVKLNGNSLGAQDVKARGSVLTYRANSVGQQLDFLSHDIGGGLGGEETHIMNITVYGWEAD